MFQRQPCLLQQKTLWYWKSELYLTHEFKEPGHINLQAMYAFKAHLIIGKNQSIYITMSVMGVRLLRG